MKKLFPFLILFLFVFSCSYFDKRDKTLMYDEFVPTNYLKKDSICNESVLSIILYKSMYNKFAKNFNETNSSDERYAINKKIAVLNNLSDVDSLLNFNKQNFNFYLKKNSKIGDKGKGIFGLVEATDEYERAMSFALSKYSNIEDDFNENYDTFRQLIINTIIESKMVSSDENSKTFQLRYYNSNIEEIVLIKFSFDENKNCTAYQFL